MRVLVQRVKEARVHIAGELISEIQAGFLLLVGIDSDDGLRDGEWMADKISTLRICEDPAGKMNLNIIQSSGAILSVPNFTLCANLDKGHRPGFDRAAKPEAALELWKKFNQLLVDRGISLREGKFGEHMDVQLTNDGPVTIWLDSASSR